MDEKSSEPVLQAPPQGPKSGEGRGRTHREILRETKRFAREDRVRSWYYVLSTLAVLVGLLALTALPLPSYGRVAAGVLAGFVAVRMFILYHDHQHGAILRRSKTGKLLLSLYGLLTLSPPSPWNRSHNYHHANNSKILGASIGSYPIMTVEAFEGADRWKRFQYVAARHPLTILFGYVTVFLYGMTLRPFLLNPKQHLDCAAALVLHGVLIGVLAWWSPAALLFTLGIPLFLACVFGSYLFYAQHNFPDVRLRPRSNWDLVTAAMESSSYMKLSPLMNWLTANIGYHHIHHLNPHIPFYRLPEVMTSVEGLTEAGRTTLSVRDIYRCLRLKLWDSRKGRMIAFSERR